MLKSIQNEEELGFAIFCIENIAAYLNQPAEKVYDALAMKSSILDSYIVPCYEALHTQGKDYIIADILEVMEEQGISI